MSPSHPNLDRYFARIGYTGPHQPTREVLEQLHFRHVSTIPFENLDVLLGRGIRIDLPSIEEKLINQKRGGYCFEQNTLFAAVLRMLGFEVTTLAARVRWKVPVGTALPRTHMTLLVTCHGDRLLADVGFGGLSLTAPIRLDCADAQTTPLSLRRIARSGDEYLHQAWRSDAWLDVYSFTLEPHSIADYEMANWYTSTYPGSRFRQNLVVARSDSDRHYTLANRDFAIRHGNGTIEKRLIGDADELIEVLQVHFGLDFPRGTRFGPPGSPWPS